MNDLQIRQMQISAAKDEIRCCNELNQIYGLTPPTGDDSQLLLWIVLLLLSTMGITALAVFSRKRRT